MEQWLVLGVGNTLLRDEGAGVHVVRHLENEADGLSDVELIDAGTLSFTLAPRLEGISGIVIVDAARMNEPPGTVRVVEGAEMDRFLDRHRRLSVHEVSLTDLLGIARATGALPARRALIGIEPECIEWGEMPGDTVAQAVPRAGALVREIIARWREESANPPELSEAVGA